MERSDRAALALARAESAYARTHGLAALRGVAIAAALVALATCLHRTSDATWLTAGALAITLGALGWRGGPWRRGGLAGVLAGVPPLIAPSLVFAVRHGGHCASCAESADLPCLLACVGTSSLVGLLVGHRAVADRSPRAFATAALVTAALTGVLGCTTTGYGGALGVAVGLVAGGVTGWVVAGRTAHA